MGDELCIRLDLSIIDFFSSHKYGIRHAFSSRRIFFRFENFSKIPPQMIKFNQIIEIL
jgi:hypothetical protein